MRHFGRLWIRCALASLLVHGLALSVALPQRGHTRCEFVEVSLVPGELQARSQGKKTGGNVDRDTKAGAETKGPEVDRGREKIGSANNETGRGRAKSAPPRTERAGLTPSVSAALPGKIGFGDAASDVPQGFGEGADPESGGRGTGVTGDMSDGGKRPGGDDSTGRTTAAFGGPEGPRFVHREIPEYPLYARRRKMEGRVLLMLRITEHGGLSSVEVVEASDPVFVGPSLEAVKRSSFAPAMRKGVAVSVRTLLPIRFTLNGGASPTQYRSHE